MSGTPLRSYALWPASGKVAFWLDMIDYSSGKKKNKIVDYLKKTFSTQNIITIAFITPIIYLYLTSNATATISGGFRSHQYNVWAFWEVASMFIYFILVFIFDNSLIMLLTLISPILLIFHEQITSIYMKYKINKHKKYIESLDKITYHKGGFVLPQHIPLKFSSDINITDIKRLREELSKVDYDTTELNNTLDKLEILIKLKK